MNVRGRLVVMSVGAAAVIAVACFDVVGPNEIAALDFEGVPFPAIVTGDTMRDAAGIATPLTAVAYNGNGDVIAGAPITFLSLDTGVTISAAGYLVATRRSGSVRLLASIAGLQSAMRTIDVAREPDSIPAPVDSIITYNYALPDLAANVSPSLQLRLMTGDTTGGLTPNVKGWLVRWRIVHDGDTLAVSDTSLVALWAPSGTKHTLTDTTKTDGTSGRRLRVYANLLPTAVDSFIVIAEIRSRGVPVTGSPVRFVVNIAPPPP